MMGQSRPLSEVLADILTLDGALLEKTGDGCLEFLIPPSLSKILDIPEHGKLSFAYHPFDESAISASYESEFFRSVDRLFSGRGKTAKAVYSPQLPNIEKVPKWVSEKIALSNATFRLQKVENQRVSYALIFFKYVALSDEKREGIFSLLVNEQNLSTSPLNANLTAFWEDLKEPEELLTRSEGISKALQAGFSAVSLMVKEEFEPFIKSLERRLNRDIKRVFEYYETLKFELQMAFEKKVFLRKDSPEGQNEEGRKILSGKLDAVEGEKKWKIQDLISKYALNVRIEPVCIIDIETESLVFWLEIKRRLYSRIFPLTYNPLLKKVDSLPCEGCFYPRGTYYVCDEKLHILCATCFRKCTDCGRQYCSVCHPKGCPRCKN
jgi:hypothetical protein